MGDAEQPGRRGRGCRLLPVPALLPRAVGLVATRPGRAYAGARLPSAPGSTARDERGVETPRAGMSQRAEMTGRLGLILLGLACALHFVSLVGRGMAADPNRVPWGNMYEFTLVGHLRGRVHLPGRPPPTGPRLGRPARGRDRADPADDRGDLALRPGRPAHRGAQLLLARHPRRLRRDRDRCVHARWPVLGALPGQGAQAADEARPATSRACPSPRRSTGRPTACTPSPSPSGPSRC